ncbi:MAG: hypothetical protein LUD17_05095 [Bacteroidales bacterium]|nr:hypothetical protein [Bacteroidales bacterium]
MRPRFKLSTRYGFVSLLRLHDGLFGTQWETLARFSQDCLPQCKRIVSMLNECDKLTNKESDDEERTPGR